MPYLPRDVTFFEVLRAMNETRPFKLVFLLEISKFLWGEVLWGSAEALELMVAEGTFDFLDSSPTIRIARSRNYGWARPPDFD